MQKITGTANHILATVVLLIAAAVAPSRLDAQTTLAGGVVTRQGTVETIDYANRVVTIRGDAGPITVSVPAAVARFNQVKVGDIVTVTYDDRIVARLKAANESSIDSLTTAANLVPTPGPLPAGWSGSTRTVTMTIKTVDVPNRAVTYTDTQGRGYFRRLADTTDPALLAKLQPGDRVDVTWNNTATIDVQTPAPAAAQAAASDRFINRFTFAFTFGVDNSISGNMLTEGTGTLGTQPLSFNDTSFDDVYGRVGMWRLSAAYRTTPRTEVEVSFVKASTESEPFVVGRAGAADLTASFTDYSYWGFEVGQRFFFTRVRITPYVGYYIGLNRFKTIDATFTAPAVPGQGAINASGEFYDESWAFSFAPNAGFLVGIGPVEGIAQIDFRYIGELSDAVPLDDAGLRDINQESSRWSIPFTFGIRFRF